MAGKTDAARAFDERGFCCPVTVAIHLLPWAICS